MQLDVVFVQLFALCFFLVLVLIPTDCGIQIKQNTREKREDHTVDKYLAGGNQLFTNTSNTYLDGIIVSRRTNFECCWDVLEN